MGLHVFRDLNWYTIEKSAIFWIPLFLVGLLRWWRGQKVWWLAPVLLLSAWMNLYLGLINCGLLAIFTFAVVAFERERIGSALRLCGVSFLALLPLLLWQWAILRTGPTLATPDEFLWERAALDSFTVN